MALRCLRGPPSAIGTLWADEVRLDERLQSENPQQLEVARCNQELREAIAGCGLKTLSLAEELEAVACFYKALSRRNQAR